MALACTRDLSLINFVGIEEKMTMPDREEGIDAFAFVSAFATSRLKEVESALKKREERKAVQDRIKLHQHRLVPYLSIDVIPYKKMSTTEKKATTSKEERPPPHPSQLTSSMRPQGRRRMLNEYSEENGSRRATPSELATASDLLELQVIDTEPNLKRKKKMKDDEKPKKKKQRVTTRATGNTGPDPPPDLPKRFKERIERLGCRNPVLVIQKRLYSTDVAKQQNMLSIPQSALKTYFLQDHELALLDSRSADGHCKALKPKILDATGEDRIISLRKWNMNKDNGAASTTTYNLNKPWYDMVKANDWESGDLVQVWTFKVEEELDLAIDKLEEN